MLGFQFDIRVCDCEITPTQRLGRGLSGIPVEIVVCCSVDTVTSFYKETPTQDVVSVLKPSDVAPSLAGRALTRM
jgi:hypothetical protein